MNPEVRRPSSEEMESIAAGLEVAEKEAQLEAEGKEKLKDLTDEDVAAGLSTLEEDSQRAAAQEWEGVADEDMDKAMENLGEKEKIDAARKKAQKTAENKN